MLTVQPLSDPDIIHQIVTDPWIADRLRHDGREPGYIDHPALTYHGAYIGGILAGVFLAIRVSPWETEVHAALLKRAIPYSRDLGALFLAHLWRDPKLLRISAPVMEALPSAGNYCLKLGFELEGFKRDAVVIGGVQCGVYQLGLTRNDWRRRMGLAA